MPKQPPSIESIVRSAAFADELESTGEFTSKVSRPPDGTARMTTSVAPDNGFSIRTDVDELTTYNALFTTIDSGDGLLDWPEVLSWVADSLRSPQSAAEPVRDLPFGDLLFPVVGAARRRRPLPETRIDDLFLPDAFADLDRSLLRRLSDATADVLFESFSSFRNSRLGPQRSFDIQGDQIYQEFVAHFRSEGLDQVLSTHPVLGRLLAILTKQWMNWTSLLFLRYAQDRNAISREFYSSEDQGRVAAVSTQLSDPHRGGQTVLILRYESGKQVVYKPRTLEPEVAWNDILAWVNRRGPANLEIVKAISRRTFGWMQSVEREPVSDVIQAHDYFHNSGAILFLLYVLGVNDMHGENVMSGRRGPVIVDLETMLKMRAPVEFSVLSPARKKALGRISDSVLATGFLPAWEESPGGDAVPIGALNHNRIRRSGEWRFVAPNSDGMQRSFVYGNVAPGPGGLFFESEAAMANAHATEVARGFRDMYEFFFSNKSEVLSPGGPLAMLKGIKLRYVARPTRLYALMLKRALEPNNLRTSGEWTRTFCILERISANSGAPATSKALIRYEMGSLRDLDIPYFEADSSRTGVMVRGRTIARVGSRSGYQSAIDRVRQLSMPDCRRQESLILASFAIDSRAQEAETDFVVEDGVRGPVPIEIDRDEINVLVSEAERQAATLARAACRASGTAAWMGVIPLSASNAGYLYLSVCGHDLYAGATGIALFLSALFKVTRQSSCRNLALSAVASIRQEAFRQGGGEAFVNCYGIGGISGTGSICYGLALISSLAEYPEGLTDALSLARYITRAAIESDTRFDVVSGVAGVALSFLAIHALSPSTYLLDQARLCGQHLITRRVRAGRTGCGWNTSFGNPLTGFAHGAAGIALALYRLFEATGEHRFREVADEAVAFERETYSEKEGNWPDLRFTTPQYVAQWCHGAAGIGLARVGTPPSLRNRKIEREILAATKATTDRFDGTLDDVCCGNLGRIELLLAAGLQLKRPDFVETARRAACAVVYRAQRTGYRLKGGLPEMNPGFFSGISGIGYQLLRIACPHEIPSVTLLEP